MTRRMIALLYSMLPIIGSLLRDVSFALPFSQCISEVLGIGGIVLEDLNYTTKTARYRLGASIELCSSETEAHISHQAIPRFRVTRDHPKASQSKLPRCSHVV